MLHGKGRQGFLTKSFENKRRKVLQDRTKYSEDTIEDVGITDLSSGGGNTNYKSFIIKSFPFPLVPSIRKKKMLDLRKKDPRIGD